MKTERFDDAIRKKLEKFEPPAPLPNDIERVMKHIQPPAPPTLWKWGGKLLTYSSAAAATVGGIAFFTLNYFNDNTPLRSTKKTELVAPLRNEVSEKKMATSITQSATEQRFGKSPVVVSNQPISKFQESSTNQIAIKNETNPIVKIWQSVATTKSQPVVVSSAVNFQAKKEVHLPISESQNFVENVPSTKTQETILIEVASQNDIVKQEVSNKVTSESKSNSTIVSDGYSSDSQSIKPEEKVSRSGIKIMNEHSNEQYIKRTTPEIGGIRSYLWPEGKAKQIQAPLQPQLRLPENKGKWFVSAGISPWNNYASIESEYVMPSGWSFSAGLAKSEIAETKYVTVKLFDLKHNKDFRDKYAPKVPRTIDILNIRMQDKFVQLPLSVRYYLPVTPSISFVTKIGTELNLKTTQSTRFSLREGFVNFQEKELVESPSPKLFGHLTASAGIQAKYQRFAIQAAPSVRLRLNNANSYRPEPESPWAMNLRLLYRLK